MFLRTYEALAVACRDAGVSTAFGLVGDGNVKFVHHLTQVLGVRYLATRHESAAITMASGAARASGGVGFATVTQGPGLTNALTALIAAAKASLPMVVFAGLPPTTLPGHPQRIDQEALLAVAGVGHQVIRPDHLHGDVATAFARARSERRPIGIFLPTDVQDADLPEQLGTAAPPAHQAVSTAVTGPIREVADHLLAAERPILLAGRGCLGSEGAREAIMALADELGALLATTLPIRGYFEDHPFAIGVMGGFSPDQAVAEAERADVIVAIGASLNYRATRSGQLFRGDATVIQIDRDPTPEGASVAVGLSLTGDAATVVAALREAVSGRAAAASVRTDELAARLAHRPTMPSTNGHRRRDDVVDPRELMQGLDQLLPEQRSVTVDGGHSSGFPSIHLRVPDHHGYLFALEFAAIGLGIGTAMGAAVARPDRRSVLVVGDGSLLMSLPDLETAVRERIPLLVVVMNDEAYGSEIVILEHDELPPDLGLLPTPSFEEVALALGAQAATVRSVSDLVALAPRIEALDGPFVIDARIDPTVRGAWLEGAFNRSLAVRA
jgi:acetolactate synthase I/II/III large subunit